MDKEDFVRIIDTPHVIEMISERFDDALELMGKMSLVYGGALRDILAGLPIGGDLDIVVNNYVFHDVVATFQSSYKWTRVGSNGVAQIPKVEPVRRGKNAEGRPTTASYRFGSVSAVPMKNPYDKAMPMTEVISFETFKGARVQLVRAQPDLNGSMDEPLKMAFVLARDADIRCCSIAMDYLGKIYELVDGAYLDCKEKILRANKMNDFHRFLNVRSRVEKLKARGWKSKIDLKRLRENIKKQQKVYKKEAPKTVPNSAAANQIGLIVEPDTARGGYLVLIDPAIARNLKTDIRQVVSNCRRDRGTKFKEVAPKPGSGYITYSTMKLKDVDVLANYMMRYIGPPRSVWDKHLKKKTNKDVTEGIYTSNTAYASYPGNIKTGPVHSHAIHDEMGVVEPEYINEPPEDESSYFINVDKFEAKLNKIQEDDAPEEAENIEAPEEIEHSHANKWEEINIRNVEVGKAPNPEEPVKKKSIPNLGVALSEKVRYAQKAQLEAKLAAKPIKKKVNRIKRRG